MTYSGRDPGLSDTTSAVRGVRQGSISSRELRGLQPASRRSGSWRGLFFVGFITIAIVGGLVLAVGPTFRELAWNTAKDNPQAMHLPFVGDAVRDRLGSALTEPAGTSEAPRVFVVETGQGLKTISENLKAQGLIKEPLAFQYLVVSSDLDAKLQVGNFTLRPSMTPREVVDRLVAPPDPVRPKVLFAPRVGRRLEQIVALIESKGPQQLDVQAFYDEVLDPPDALRADYPFLKELPRGRSLEGFMGAGTFSVDIDITADGLVRLLLDDWQRDIGQPAIDAAKQKGLDFYRVLTIASIVERETAVDAERGKIAGVYVNRLDSSLNGTLIMNADPTVIYAVDTGKLRKLPFAKWYTYEFWTLVEQSLSRVKVSDDLKSYQTYVNPGLPDGPIDTPSLPSINAAISPETKQGYLYFYACPGKNTHLFAKTLAQQRANIASCK